MEENFNNQVDRMIYSVDASWPLFPAIPVIAQWAPEYKVMVAGMKVIHGLNNMDFRLPKPT